MKAGGNRKNEKENEEENMKMKIRKVKKYRNGVSEENIEICEENEKSAATANIESIKNNKKKKKKKKRERGGGGGVAGGGRGGRRKMGVSAADQAAATPARGRQRWATAAARGAHAARRTPWHRRGALR
jgi:hypothetical protein